MNIKKFLRFAAAVFSIYFFTSNICLAQNQPASQSNINFTKFSVVNKNNKIFIDWSTDDAIPTNYFEIQRSSDGKNFKTIALVLGPDPQQKAGNCYSCFDKYNAKMIKHYTYRLKHIDVNGMEQISEVKTVESI